MHHPLLGLAILVVLTTLFAPAPVQGQSLADSPGTRASSAWTPPRTPWGDPDLQGIWPSSDMLGTPLERSADFGRRAVLTDEEFAAREAQSRRQADFDAETVVVQRPRPDGRPGTGPPSHWGERGTPTRQASLIIDPPDGRLPAMTPEGQRRAKLMRSTYHLDFPDAVEAHPFNEFTDLGPYDRCISRGPLASMLPTGYNMGTQIFQVPGSVVIVNEMIHETRVIALDGRPHLGSSIRQYMGDSRGRWEGDTLVVETTNLNGKVGLTRNGNTTPTSQDLRIVERFTRVADDTIRYEATIEDPQIWARPWKVTLPLKEHPEYGMFEYACHEGNYGMTNILSGARADEKRVGKR
ncbi:MAG: hypothetical protein ACRD1Q_13385 [Vicinamibacterales bacterium]